MNAGIRIPISNILYAVQGRSNSGKTTALKYLFKLITDDFPDSKVNILRSGGIDIAAIIDDGNGIRIGIESQGDPNSDLPRSLAKFSDDNCNYIFCACRTRGMTVDAVRKMHPKYEINFIPKPLSDADVDAMNKQFALNLYSLIQQIR